MAIVSDSKLFVAGHQGMVGSAVVRELKLKNYQNIVTRSRTDLDLTAQDQVADFMRNEKPDAVVLAAAKVGGIQANNQYPAEFIYENLAIQSNVIHQAYKAGVKSLLFLGSSCIYPKFADQPIKEEYLLSGHLEPTNEPYAISKIAGIKLCESYNRQYGVDYRSAMPTNLYGPNDNFNLENSHVIPALIQKIHNAKVENLRSVNIWGTGKPRREFLHVDDVGNASVFLMECSLEKYQSITEPMLSHVNIGSGSDLSIAELAKTICNVIGFKGKLIFDSSKPDGTMRKLMDNTKLSSLGWKPKHSLKNGLHNTYDWFLNHQDNYRS